VRERNIGKTALRIKNLRRIERRKKRKLRKRRRGKE